MKKISAIEAESVVGGTCETCESVYQNVTTGGVTSCKLITTCTDKYGSTMTMTDANSSNCGGILNR